jgi:hypothetical protein
LGGAQSSAMGIHRTINSLGIVMMLSRLVSAEPAPLRQALPDPSPLRNFRQ